MMPTASARSTHPAGTIVIESTRMMIPNDKRLDCQAWQPRSGSVHTVHRPYGCCLRFRRSTQFGLNALDVDITCSFGAAAQDAGADQQIAGDDVVAAASAKADGCGENARGCGAGDEHAAER